MPHRNEQFEKIAKLKEDYQTAGHPVISIDTKKKEYLGNFYRSGRIYTREVIETYDHDFPSFAEGIIIPHAIYDLAQNKGYITLGTSSDTSAFACENLKQWWLKQGCFEYPNASSLLILCDGGGSNHSRHYLFKENLQKLANELHLAIRIAHYPPYCSKYNPIEHRLFPHVTRACQGVVFKSIQLVEKLMARTSTKQGLSVTVNILDKVFQTGRKASKDFRQSMPIVFDKVLPQWNYTAVPQI